MRGYYIFMLWAWCLCSSLHAQDLETVIHAKPIVLSGSLGIGLGTYSAQGIPARAREFQYLFSGAPTLTLYGVSFPFSVVVSDQQRSFRQPFNQYGVSPYYKWAKLHLGWRNLNFSPFTLAGHAFLGTGIELTPGKWRFGAMYGRFVKAVEDNPTAIGPFGHLPAYRRTGHSVKLGYGTQERYVDLIWLKGRDHENSLQTPITSEIILPTENVVMGLSTKFKIIDGLHVEGDMAISIYTRNRTDTSTTMLDQLPGLVSSMSDLLRVNNSSQLLTAGSLALAYQKKNMGIKAEYKRVDPDYQSIGAYYFETDVENYTVSPSLTLDKGKLRLQGSMGLQYDNLKKEKAVRSQKIIGSGNVSYQQPLYGVDIRYSNYGISQRQQLVPIPDDRRIARTNHNLNVMGRYTIASDPRLVHNIVALAGLQSLNDQNPYTSAFTETNTTTANLNYQISIQAHQLNASFGYTYTLAELASFKTSLYGPSLSIGKQLYKNKIQAQTAWNWQKQVSEGATLGDVINGNFNLSWRAHSKGSVKAGLIFLKSAASPIVPKGFHELRTNLGYTHIF